MIDTQFKVSSWGLIFPPCMQNGGGRREEEAYLVWGEASWPCC